MSGGDHRVSPTHFITKAILRGADVDPEDDPFPQDDEDESDDEEAPEGGGREHYETVGKSKLRKPEQPQLDKKYGGVAVSRAELENDDVDPFAPVDDDEDEDPFAVNNQEVDDNETSPPEGSEADDVSMRSDDELELGEKKYPHLTRRSEPVKALANGKSHIDHENGSSDEDEDEDEGDEDDDRELQSQGSDATDDEEGSESDQSDVSAEEASGRNSTGRDALMTLRAPPSSESAVVSSLTAAATDEARKGAAVEQQQTAFDRLLNSRIKMQKALTLSNELTEPSELEESITDAAAKAEAAALSLWTTIDSIRCDILSHQSASRSNSKKRKISALKPSPSTALSELHGHSQDLESAFLPDRQATLNQWNSRTRPTSAPSTSRTALSAPDTTTISSVLSTYMNTSLSKLVSTSTPSPQTYDDTTFYQSLLTSLIASRTNAASLPSSLPSALPSSNNPKIRKAVDKKASKGRKIRYTVHEKLQNFMAPEDRSTWTEEGRREFFGSLFGQQASGEPAMQDDDVEEEDGALRLFRSTAAA